MLEAIVVGVLLAVLGYVLYAQRDMRREIRDLWDENHRLRAMYDRLVGLLCRDCRAAWDALRSDDDRSN